MGGAPETFRGDALGVGRGSRQERIAAANTVLAAIPDIEARREVLAALFGSGEAWRKRAANARRRDRQVALKPCGTEAAYQRHKARGEKCDVCLAAANAVRAESQRRIRAARRAEAAAAEQAA